ncbi:MAG: DNA polymerase III subunit gamma/tau [Armatimonadota bacterium]|nr:DNA polymerase III subunit gamma/tau [Armatimonadota bacterium]
MAYVSLYRKYRPQTFDDVVGQDHVTTTLRHAIQEGRVASGYLFTGTRGTAKTTCARIMAKALNCIGPEGILTAPTSEPCGVCGPCQAIAGSNFVDVLEMDAASHGKVDDVRDLVASIKFPPMEGRYKVYIIDEAHQLSRDAMDAFLKTLEEPPDRVVFILATTELDKLPITIASRCQVFEFKRGSVAQISGRLGEVLKAEGVKAAPAAVTLVARGADGSYRDSLSLLEQVLAYKRQDITVKDVTTVLGTIDEDVLNRVIDLIANSDAAGGFTLAAEILESGKDVRQFLKSLSARMRDMLFVSVGAQPADGGDLDDSPGLREQAARFAPASLLHALETLTEAEQETKRSNQHRLLLEMTLLRLMRLPQAAASPTTYVAPPVTPVIRPVARVETPSAKPEPPEAEMKPIAPAVVTPPAPVDETLPPPLTEEELEETDTDEGTDAGASDLTDDEDNALTLDVSLPGDDDLDTLPTDDEPSLLVTSPTEHDAAEDFMQVQQVAVEPPPIPGNGHAPEPVPLDAAPELIQLQKSWQEVINRMSSKPSTMALIKDAHPIALHGKTFTLRFTSRFFVDKLEKNERGRQVIEEAVNKTLRVEPETYRIKGVLEGDTPPAKIGQGQAPRAVRVATPAPVPETPSQFFDEVHAVFGGQIIDDRDIKG